MIQTFEAIVDADGTVRLLGKLQLEGSRRAIVTILDEPAGKNETALLSEAALKKDWLRPEEDAAWAHLHPGK